MSFRFRKIKVGSFHVFDKAIPCREIDSDGNVTIVKKYPKPIKETRDNYRLSELLSAGVKLEKVSTEFKDSADEADSIVINDLLNSKE